MQDGHDSALAGCISYSRAEYVVLGESNCTGILHSASVEIRHPELVVFLKRIWDSEEVLEEVKTLLGLLEDVFRIHVLPKRLAAKDPERDGSA